MTTSLKEKIERKERRNAISSFPIEWFSLAQLSYQLAKELSNSGVTEKEQGKTQLRELEPYTIS